MPKHMRDSSTHPVHTHSSGLPPRPAVSLHPPLYFQLAWIFKDLTSFSPIRPTVYTANVSMGATVNVSKPRKLGTISCRGTHCHIYSKWSLCTNVYDTRGMSVLMKACALLFLKWRVHFRSQWTCEESVLFYFGYFYICSNIKIYAHI